jgi:glutamate dehydrogenase
LPVDPMQDLWETSERSMAWLRQFVPGLFTGTLREDVDVLGALALGLRRLGRDRQLVLADRDQELVVATLDLSGSIFETLRGLGGREVSRAEITHSQEPVPGGEQPLELQRYRFDPKPDDLVGQAGDVAIPPRIQAPVRSALEALGEPADGAVQEALLRTLWINDPSYLRLAPPAQVAQMLRLLHQGQAHAGFFLDLEAPEDGPSVPGEVNLLFAVEGPRRGHLLQVFEVLNRLDLGIRRCLTLTLGTGSRPFFLGSFHVAPRAGGTLEKGSELFEQARHQLYATQVMAPESPAYRDFVLAGIMTGEEAALVNAMIGFCHTSCAHNQPHRYTFEDVVRAFHSDPAMALRLVRLFATRFDPRLPDREARFEAERGRLEQDLSTYNTGHRMLDDFRRSVFQVALAFVRRTLKTNYFVPEKHALAFRLDPRYLEDLGPAFTSDLPAERPFRVTFFFGRGGLGYHVGFADIARGGWRTIFTRTRDDYVTVANTLFRESYVLAHTQHLKNKDIYEGGSKLVCVLWAPEAETSQQVDRGFHTLQRDFTGAFLDVFVTAGGRPRDPRVVDYYGDDEPIELGPDENMHDEMIEAIAELSVRREYLLGAGIMSSKRVGINHKRYGVTSRGVVTFAEIAMRELGVDLRADPFTVKLTGGPDGDVAGNCLRLLLERCPRAAIRLVLDGTAALFDPAGLDHRALGAIVLREDACAFDPGALSPGGFLLFRNERRKDGLRELHRRLERTPDGLREAWVTLDDFHREYSTLPFTVPADLFIPAGGRPESVDEGNWRGFLGPDGKPTARVIVEGANSYVTPAARKALQEAGVVVLRDASANKCGVISSSYEIIGNLLLDEREFTARREEYVRDVLEILERRAADEAHLIFLRHRQEAGRRSYTEISEALSVEINGHKARLFEFFEAHPRLCQEPPYRAALLSHLPRLVREAPELRGRVDRLPSKYRSAILAAEIATTMVYRHRFEPDFGTALRQYVVQAFGEGS